MPRNHPSLLAQGEDLVWIDRAGSVAGCSCDIEVINLGKRPFDAAGFGPLVEPECQLGVEAVVDLARRESVRHSLSLGEDGSTKAATVNKAD
jgi:hypothetical protein